MFHRFLTSLMFLFGKQVTNIWWNGFVVEMWDDEMKMFRRYEIIVKEMG